MQEEKGRNNTAMLTVIAIATLLVAVVGATFAYFSTAQNNDANVTVQAETKAADTFTATGSPAVSLEVTAAQMQETAGNDDHSVIANSADANGNVTVSLTAGSGNATCTYDLIYTPTSAFTTSTAVAAKEALTDKSEFVLSGDSSIAANDFANVNLAGNAAITLKTGATITDSGADTTATVDTWLFTAKFFNLGTEQSDNANKTFGGNITVANVVCTNSSN